MKEMFDQILHALHKVGEHLWVKILGGTLWMLIGAKTEYLVLMVVLITLDTVTGVQAARRRNEKVRSHLLRRVATKATGYAVFLLTWTMVGNAYDAQWVTSWAFGALSITEGYSITENVFGAKGRELTNQLRGMISGRGGFSSGGGATVEEAPESDTVPMEEDDGHRDLE